MAVWVTGMGAVTPGGWSVPQTWDTVVNGRSCVQPVDRFVTFPESSRVAGMVPGRADTLPSTSLSREYGTTAVREALATAGLDAVEVALTATHGERRLARPGWSGRVAGIEELAGAMAAAAGADRSSAVFGACAGSAQAIGLGLALIRSGDADVVLAGGCDALVSPADFFAFSALYVMSTRDCPPAEASCPFDTRRDGFVLAEGAAFLVLESERHARRRGARPLAELAGFGLAQNAYHMFASPPDGVGPTRAIRAALRDARLDPADIDYVNAHGTSTKDNDDCESRAIRSTFGPAADRVQVSSNKSQLGHTMGASGAIEAVLSVSALLHQTVPPTSNLHRPDPACDLDYVPLTARETPVNHVLSNSFGFGGHSAALVLGRAA